MGNLPRYVLSWGVSVELPQESQRNDPWAWETAEASVESGVTDSLDMKHPVIKSCMLKAFL